MELFDGIEYVRAYIDDLLILTKSNFDDHLEKLELVLQRVQEAGLKVNAPKSFDKFSVHSGSWRANARR